MDIITEKVHVFFQYSETLVQLPFSIFWSFHTFIIEITDVYQNIKRLKDLKMLSEWLEQILNFPEQDGNVELCFSPNASLRESAHILQG